MKDPAQITEELHELYEKAKPDLFKAFREANTGREAPGMIEYGIVYEDAVQELRSVAFTNVNKVTGSASVNAAYYEMAQSKVALDTLWEEIRILDPKVVLFCGTAWLLGEDGLDQLRSDGRKVLDLWHPGARKRKAMMIDAVKQQLREEEG